MIDHRLTPAPQEPPLRVQAECRAAAAVISSLEQRGLRLRMDVGRDAGRVQVAVVNGHGRVAACLAGRDLLELLCGRARSSQRLSRRDQAARESDSAPVSYASMRSLRRRRIVDRSCETRDSETPRILPISAPCRPCT